MALGTKMTLHRYGGRAQDWRDQLVIIDQAYLQSHTDTRITLNYPNEVGSDLLEVYYNGQRLSLGGGYFDIDDTTISINLGTEEDGTPIPFDEGDELYIKFWENHYYNRGGNQPSATDITHILRTVDEILHYGGAYNTSFSYEYNDLNQVVREVATGGQSLIRELTYTAFDEIETETIFFKDKVIKRMYEYDPETKRLLKSSVKVI